MEPSERLCACGRPEEICPLCGKAWCPACCELCEGFEPSKFGPADGPLTNEEIEAVGVRLPAWDQSDGVTCARCGGDATLCGHLELGAIGPEERAYLKGSDDGSGTR